MELLSKLGINWKLLAAQLINFAILFYVLRRFAYQPIVKMLNERSQKIEKGLRDADESRKKLAEIMEKEKEVLKEARAEARVIVAKAEEQAKKSREEIAAEARRQAENILENAKKKIAEEKNKMMAEAKEEIAELVVSAAEKIIGEKLDAGKDAELIQKSLGKRENQDAGRGNKI